METKLKRIMRIRGISELEAEAVIRRHDKKRKAYHNYYCQTKWGDARNYDMAINCSKLGMEGTADIMEQFIRRRNQ